MTAPIVPKVVTTKSAPQSPDAIRQAPMVPSQSPFVVKARALEAQLEQMVDSRNEQRKLQKHAVEAQLAELRRIEGLRVAGANPMTPMATMRQEPLMEASLKNPDMVVRWVNEGKAGRPDIVKGLGYRKLSESEGGKQLGQEALYAIPRERYGELEAVKRLRTASRLQSYKSEVQEAAEQVLGELRERGYDFKVKDHLIAEE